MDQHVKRGNDQTIARLTPLADALAVVGKLAKPVAASEVSTAESAGCVLAADVTGSLRPQRPSALRDGWAVRAEELADGGGYAPVALTRIPKRVETGDELPAGTDTVAPPDFIAVRDNAAEAGSAIAPGEGVLISIGWIG